MRIVVQTTAGDREVEVALRNPEATLGELLHAVLGTEIPASVAIDERAVPAWWRVVDVGLHEGSTLAPVPEDRRPGGSRRWPLELVVLSGLDAGREFATARGPLDAGPRRGQHGRARGRFGLAAPLCARARR